MSEKERPRRNSAGWLVLLLLVGLIAAFWGSAIVKEFRAIRLQDRVIRLQEGFVEAVGVGDLPAVFALLDEYDPAGTGTVQDWAGIDGDGRPGFVWLLEKWRGHNLPEGGLAILERWVAKNPSYPREELLKQLRWLKNRGEDTYFRELFLVMLVRDLELPEENLGEHPLSWVMTAGADPDLLMMAWQRHRESGSTLRLPDSLFSAVVSPERLAAPESLEQVLRLTGLLDPAASFQLVDSPWQPSSDGGKTWIEWFYFQNLSSGKSDRYQIRRRLKKEFFPTAGPETPGLFLLKCLSSSSDEIGHSEIFASDLATVLPHLEALPESSKPAMAEFLARYLVSFDNNQALREWVWTYFYPSWQNRGREILSHSQGPPGEHKRILNAWLWAAVKSGHAGEVSPVVCELWKEHVDQHVAEGASMQESGLKSGHPYQLARSTERSAKEGLFDASGFDLLLAVARDPATPPSMELPGASALVVRNLKSRAPWQNRTLEEVLDMLNDLGEKHVDDPLRFLIVASFHAERVFLTEAEDIARFQIVAEQNDDASGWLAKDLADLLPSRFPGSEWRGGLLASGGHLHSFACVNRYLADDRAPVAARLSFAMTVLPGWGELYFPEQFPHLNSGPAGEVELGPSALEFASAVSAGQWPTDSIHMYFWQQVIDRWIHSTAGRRTEIGEASRAEARRLLRVHFEELAQRELSALTGAIPAADSKEMKRVLCLWKLYASLLRADGDGDALVRFRNELPDFPEGKNPVFPWLPSSVVRWDRSDARLASETYLTRFRREGEKSIRAEDLSVSGEGTSGVRLLTEVSASLKMREWMEFCGGVLDRMEQVGVRDRAELAAFYVLPPETGWDLKDKKETEARVRSLLSTASRLPDSPGHSEFFSLALLPVVRACLKEPDTAEYFLKKLESDTTLVIAPEIRSGLASAAEAMVSTRYGRYLETLRNEKIPLAQRWLAANYLLISRFELKHSWPREGEAWEAADRALVEVALDLLIEAIDLKLPVWEIVDRGLGRVDEKSYHRTAALAAFRHLYRDDPLEQEGRIRDLLRPDRVEFLLLKREVPTSVHPSLYRLAVDSGDHERAASLFDRIRDRLVFGQQVNWLVRASDWHGLADLLAGNWSELDRFGAADFMEISDSAMNEVTALLPEGDDLKFLVRLFFRPRLRKDALLDSAREEISDRLRQVGREFLEREFTSAGIEALCLGQLPIRIREFPELEAWLDSRMGDRKFSDFLESDEQTFRSEWPYWSKRIEVLADTGNFEAMGEMFPRPDWFAGKNRPDPPSPWEGRETREEMLWMGFARSLAPSLYSGSNQSRRDAAQVAAELLQSPPLLHEKRTSKSLYGTAVKWNHTDWTFQAASVRQLGDLGLAALLVASLDDPEEVALEECETISLFRQPMVVGEERIHFDSETSFLAVVLGIAQTMDEKSKEKLLLRAFKTAPFQPSVIGRHEFPCYTITRTPRPPELSIPFLTEMAKLRLAQSPEDPILIGDYGLVLNRGNKAEEALPFLERALDLLRHLDQESLENEIAQTIARLKRQE